MKMAPCLVCHSSSIFAAIDLTTTVHPDGSFTETGSAGFANTYSVTQKSDGSSTLSSTVPGFYLLEQSVAVPQVSGGSYVIPVVTSTQGRNIQLGPTPVPIVVAPTFARDWYPGGALPTQPLETDIVSVSGPLTPPSECKAPANATGVYDFDEQHTRIETTGTLTTEETRRFEERSVIICRERTATVEKFDAASGNLLETDTDTEVAHV